MLHICTFIISMTSVTEIMGIINNFAGCALCNDGKFFLLKHLVFYTSLHSSSKENGSYK